MTRPIARLAARLTAPTILALAALSVPIAPANAASSTPHDCRIRSVQILNPQPVLQEDGSQAIRWRVVYRGFDGAILYPRGCPDQNGPTWGFDEEFEIFGCGDGTFDIFSECFTMLTAMPSEGDHEVSVATIQRFTTRELFDLRTVRIGKGEGGGNTIRLLPPNRRLVRRSPRGQSAPPLVSAPAGPPVDYMLGNGTPNLEN